MKCSRGCTAWTDTSTKQMWTGKGYRSIVCIECKHQSRTQDWECECQMLWHLCPIHKVDPLVHGARRAPNSSSTMKPPVELLPTSRPLPTVRMRKAGTRHTAFRAPSNKFFKSVSTTTEVVHFGLNAAACPSLARKFAKTHPHLFSAQEEGVQMPTSGIPAWSLSTHTGVCMESSESYDMVNQHQSSLIPSGTELPRQNCCGSVRTEGRRD